MNLALYDRMGVQWPGEERGGMGGMGGDGGEGEKKTLPSEKRKGGPSDQNAIKYNNMCQPAMASPKLLFNEAAKDSGGSRTAKNRGEEGACLKPSQKKVKVAPYW